MKIPVLAAALALSLPAVAQAAPITFFGENQSPGLTVTGDPLTARNSFVSTLAPGVGTEDFETPTTLPNIAFPVSSGTVTASLTGGAASINSSGGSVVGRFATSGSSYVEVDGGGGFNIAFDSAISAFGFYGTDIGDVSGSLSIQLTDSGGGLTNINVPNSTNSNSGSLLFFGFIDLTTTYTNIAFFNSGAGDFFGFDDMIVGDRQQIINPPGVPLPAAGWMLLAGLGGLGALRRRQKQKA